MDQATITQLKLLAQALSEQGKYDDIFNQLIAIAKFYDVENVDDLNGIMATLLNVKPDEETDKTTQTAAIVGAIVGIAQQAGVQEAKLKYYQTELLKSFRHLIAENDTTNVAKTINRLRITTNLEKRAEIFSRNNNETLEIAEERGEKVVWRSRLNTDGNCKFLDGKIMTTQEFRNYYPVHPNCMCTAELIPNGFEKSNKARQGDERVSNYETGSDAYIANALSTGKWGKQINPEKQARHDFETHTAGRSYLLKGVDAQKLLEEFNGKGFVRANKIGFEDIERVNTGKIIGIDGNSGQETTWIKIYHSKKGTHISPVLFNP
jgi:hypothetical protein